MPKILTEEILFNNRYRIEQAIIDTGKTRIERMRIHTQDSSAVLLYNTDSGKIILTRQYRYAVSSKVQEEILEIVAGKIDEGESPESAARRETLEEAGYQIQEGNLTRVAGCFASPGYTTELFNLFYAEVSNKNRISKGGGLESENEEITLVELELADFLARVKSGLINDCKTMITGLWLMNRQRAL